MGKQGKRENKTVRLLQQEKTGIHVNHKHKTMKNGNVRKPARYAGVGDLQLRRLAADVVQRLGALDVAAQLGDLGVRDGVDRNNDHDADHGRYHQLTDHLEHRPAFQAPTNSSHSPSYYYRIKSTHFIRS